MNLNLSCHFSYNIKTITIYILLYIVVYLMHGNGCNILYREYSLIKDINMQATSTAQ
jgi:hypothetical protein